MTCACTLFAECEPCEAAEYRRLTAFRALDDRARIAALKAAGLREHVLKRCESPMLRPYRISERVRSACVEVFQALLPDEQERIVREL